MVDNAGCLERQRSILGFMTKPSQRPFLFHFFIDSIIILLIFYLFYLFRFNSFNHIFTQISLPYIQEYSSIFFLWLISIIFSFKKIGLYSADSKLAIYKETLKVITGVSCAGILVAAVIFLAQYKFFSRQIFLESFFSLCILLSGWRAVKRLILRELIAGGFQGVKTSGIEIEEKALVLDKIDRIIRFFLYFLIAILPFSKAGVEICFSVALSLWIIKRLLLMTFRPQDSILNKQIGIFIFIGILSVISSFYFKISLHAFFSKFMEGLLLYFIIIEVIRQKRHIFIIFGLFLCAALVSCIDGVIQGLFTGVDIFRQMPMPIARRGITAAFNHPNDLAGYLLFPLMIVVASMLGKLYILKRKSQIANNKLVFASLLILFCLFIFSLGLTKSKGAQVAAILSVLISGFFIKRKIFASVIISACLVLIILLLSSIPALKAFRLEPVHIPSTMGYRMSMWMDAIHAIKDRPIFGYGINTYMRIAQMYSDKDLTYAHNCYLQMAAEMGIGGLICFLWIIGRLFWMSARLLRRFVPRSDDDHRLKFLLMGLLCGLLAFLVHSFVDTNLYSLQLNTLFWYMMGLTICVYRQLRTVE